MVPKSQKPYTFRLQSLFQMGLTKKIRENNGKKSWVAEMRKIKENMVIIIGKEEMTHHKFHGMKSEKPCQEKIDHEFTIIFYSVF